MTTKFASLCVLAYKRPEMLEECLKSLHETIDYPCEIIINRDGVEDDEAIVSAAYYSKQAISIGKNRGVGRSFQNCMGMAEGDYIFKIDTDLIFKPKWLSTCIQILDDNSDIGAVSAFNYQHYNIADRRFDITSERELCYVVKDFVSSIYGIRAQDARKIPRPTADDGLHLNFHKLAITKEDYVINQGFGLGRSVYVVADENGKPVKAKTYDEPKLFGV